MRVITNGIVIVHCVHISHSLTCIARSLSVADTSIPAFVSSDGFARLRFDAARAGGWRGEHPWSMVLMMVKPSARAWWNLRGRVMEGAGSRGIGWGGGSVLHWYPRSRGRRSRTSGRPWGCSATGVCALRPLLSPERHPCHTTSRLNSTFLLKSTLPCFYSASSRTLKIIAVFFTPSPFCPSYCSYTWICHSGRDGSRPTERWSPSSSWRSDQVVGRVCGTKCPVCSVSERLGCRAFDKGELEENGEMGEGEGRRRGERVGYGKQR